MGIFATYVGLIYNDFVSIPLQLFGPGCYTPSPDDSHIMTRQDPNCVYKFGIDPIWMNSLDDITFYNGFKMKAAVILGVAQMTLGVFGKGLNAVYFKLPYDLWHEFLPQLLMLVSLIGFMNALIITKWMTDWSGNESQAPSVVAVMINMVLNFGEVPEAEAGRFLPLIPAQAYVCKALLLLVMICPPWMLLAKPFLLKRDHELKNAARDKRGGDIELIESAKDVSQQSGDMEESMNYDQAELRRLQRDAVPIINHDGESSSLLGGGRIKKE